jgi:Mlc titration factor MtfA (ptsG expression regulator)/Flp pilus assembly protein TadD
MVFSWLRNQRRRELLAEPFPSRWRPFLHDNVRHYEHLDPPRRTAVEHAVQILAAEKSWVGGAGFNVTEEMKVTVAGQAAILVLGLEEPYYFDGLLSIIVYPGPYRHPKRLGFIPGGALRGEAWYRGPIVLSWRDVLASGRNASGGQNLVFHEFAHYLDGLDGTIDGDPPLAGREQEQNWYRVTEAEYLRLVGQARRDEVALLDHYGATNRAEFFAVATECFFEQPQAMHQKHAELYAALCDFFRQDPARWLPDAKPEVRETKRKSDDHRRADRLAALRSDDADTLFTLAAEYFNAGRYRLAAAAATRAIRLAPRDGEAYQQRALARVKQGRYRKALADCKRALRREPDDCTTYRVRGAAYLGLGKCEAAKRDLDFVLKEDKLDAEALYLRGRVWIALGQHRRAVADFDKSLAVRPLAAEVYYQNGLANQALGDRDEAEWNLAKAFQLDPLVDRR